MSTGKFRSGTPIPNVVPGCTMKVIEDVTDSLKWKVVGEPFPYTPRHINEMLIKHNLEFAWVFFAGGKELWYKSNYLAEKVNG